MLAKQKRGESCLVSQTHGNRYRFTSHVCLRITRFNAAIRFPFCFL
ncbi:hypothetical protein RBSWK_05357 [Rhodopirellula baltica SWK14]|uniref:Uncharacterized protein n=1 Tax=Rhodopirellula baltica SWK14 TaxID=993516 RepID=L7CCA3_RHOBT|nr:hypothetical protein RBSWK_05357 [Rhodopirellula baltica SWK14]